MGVSVRAPATSANLGPGFDALGLALGLYDDVTAELTGAGVSGDGAGGDGVGGAGAGGGVTVTVSGEGAGELPTGEEHLVVRAMDATFAELGVPRPDGLALTCRNRIPQARGLGSSSAAIVAGVLLARGLVAGGTERLDDTAMLRVAARLEGHPDNVAACLFGGFTIAWMVDGDAQAVRLAPAEQLRPTVFVPSYTGLTTVARGALPAAVPHPDAAHAAGRAALLVHALTAAPDRLFDATEDRLHQPYRAASAPATAALVDRLRARRVAAVVSGAGPSVLALSTVPTDFDPGEGWVRHVLETDRGGAAIQTGRMGEHAGAGPGRVTRR